MARGGRNKSGETKERNEGGEDAETLQASGRLASQAKEHLRELEQGQETEVGELDRSEDINTGFRDYANLKLKDEYGSRPIWICPNGSILLEAHSKYYQQAYDFLVAIAEPVARPEFIHEYRITPNSLYAAVSLGIPVADILQLLNLLSKNDIPKSVVEFIKKCTKNFGLAKLVLRDNRHFVESIDPQALRTLLSCPSIRKVRDDNVDDTDNTQQEERLDGFAIGEVNIEAKANRQYLELVNELDDDDILSEIPNELLFLVFEQKKLLNFVLLKAKRKK